jgi:hypothetical protein
MENTNADKKIALNIVSKKVEHKGFGAGAIDLSSVSAVILDGEEAYIDLGALHAKSKIEKGIKFTMNQADVPNGRKCFIIWTAVDRTADGGYYAGLSACEMTIDSEHKIGWKILADHVNRMDKAMKRHYLLENLNEQEKQQLKAVLIANNEGIWQRSPQELKDLLG